MAAIGTSFDQWQKDAFFSAAEEVQESADKMESVYRMWMRDRSNGVGSEVFDELCRELHISLCTAKWQLEEFERAVKLSHEENKVTVARRTQFVAVINEQISHIEKVLNDSLVEQGKEALHWVKLEEVERDELAAFLSAAPQSWQKSKDTDVGSSKNTSKDSEPIILSCAVDGNKDALAVNKDVRYEVAPREVKKNEAEIYTPMEQLNGQRRPSSRGYVCDWKIAIADEGDDADGTSNEKRSETPSCASNASGVLRRTEFVSKPKWFGKTDSEGHRPLRYKQSNSQRFKGVALLTQVTLLLISSIILIGEFHNLLCQLVQQGG